MSIVPARRLLAAVALTALATLACSDGGADSAAPTDTAGPAAQDGPTPGADAGSEGPGDPATELEALSPTDLPGEPISQFGLTTGDCFERIDDLEDGRPVTRTTRLPCEDPHRFEIFNMIQYPADHPSPYPGETVLRQFALEACYTAFEPWVGQEYELSDLDIDVIVPPQANFEDDAARYRGIHCWVERVDGEAMLGTSRGSGW